MRGAVIFVSSRVMLMGDALPSAEVGLEDRLDKLMAFMSRLVESRGGL